MDMDRSEADNGQTNKDREQRLLDFLEANEHHVRWALRALLKNGGVNDLNSCLIEANDYTGTSTALRRLSRRLVVVLEDPHQHCRNSLLLRRLEDPTDPLLDQLESLAGELRAVFRDI